MEKWYWFCRLLGHALLWPMMVKVEGTLPKKGAIVCIANHFSYFDPVLLGIILERRVCFIAMEKLFHWPLIGWLIKKTRCALPAASRGPQKEAYKLLAKDCVVVIFPEGALNKTTSLLLNFEQGFARLAIKNETPVVPITIIRLRKKFWWLPRGSKVIIGDPIFTNTGITKDQLISTAWRKMHILLRREE